MWTALLQQGEWGGLTVKGGLNEGVSWPMASNMVLSAYMRDQKARPPFSPFSRFTLVVASLATVHRVSVDFTSCTIQTERFRGFLGFTVQG